MAKQATRFPSSDAVLQTVVWLRKQGFRSVPLHPQSKAAIFQNYVKPGYKPPPDSFWQDNNHGVGVVTGPRSGGPVDIDCDCVEAIYFAARFLPQTAAVFGRNSKPRSHYLYKVDTADFDKQAFLDPAVATTIVEARGDGGHQTVAPGSIHETTGELISWSDVAFPEVTTVSSVELLRAVRKVAIATLIARHIWNPGYRNEPAKHLTGLFYYLDWQEQEVIDLISAVMDFADDDDKSRIPTIRATYKRGESGKKISGAGVLRQQLHNDPVVDKLLEWSGSPTVNVLGEYNDKYACVLLANKFRVAVFDPEEPTRFVGKDDFLNFVGTDFMEVEIDGKNKRVLKGAWWLKSARRRQYDNVDFRPGEIEDGKLLNLWAGWGVVPDARPDYDDRCEGFLDLVFDVICGSDADLAHWLINWLANIIREPMNKPMTAPVITGPEGAGKSLMVSYFGKILGASYLKIEDPTHLFGHFNQHLARTLLLHSEEALYGGDRKHAGIIRSLITDDYRMLEAKGIDAKQVRNYLRLILLSNPDRAALRAAPAQPGDRRYTMIDMGQRKAPEELIKKVLHERDNGGPAALFQYLLDFDYSPALARTNVKNHSLSELKVNNLGEVEAWWLEVLMSGSLLLDRLTWAQFPAKVPWPHTVGLPALHACMELNVRARNPRNVPHLPGFTKMLQRLMGPASMQHMMRVYSNELVGEIGIPQSWQSLNSSQLSLVNFPSLQACRRGFEKHIGQSIAWPEIDDSTHNQEQGTHNPEY